MNSKFFSPPYSGGEESRRRRRFQCDAFSIFEIDLRDRNLDPIGMIVNHIINGTTFATILNNPINFAQENDPVCPRGRDGA